MKLRCKALATAAILLLVLLPACVRPPLKPPLPPPCEPVSSPPVSDLELAFHWAPIHYQDVDQTGNHALGGRSDYISAIDFDGNWNTRDNWENARTEPLSAHGYFSVVETGTHWFILYAFYHPRDWQDSWCCDSEHENDLEGTLAVVRKDGSPYGELDALVTVAHTDFYSYIDPKSPLSEGQEDKDGDLRKITQRPLDTPHPVTAQEAEGHGLKAWPDLDIVGDGVVYVPSRTDAEEPSDPADRPVVSYRLVDIFALGGLWSRRSNPETFAEYGTFAGDEGGGCGSARFVACDEDAANAPWGWDDGDDGPILRGEIATDPAKLVRHYFRGLPACTDSYLRNAYR